MKQKKLEMRLQPLRMFEEPKVKLEQYHTPVDIAATVVHCAHSQGLGEGFCSAFFFDRPLPTVILRDCTWLILDVDQGF